MSDAIEQRLEKAEQLLREAHLLLENDMTEAAGRHAYLAGLQAALAALESSEEKAPKTHRGVQGRFYELVRDDQRFPLELRSFLSRTYQLKSIADYEFGPDAKVPREAADEAVRPARHFLDTIRAIIGNDG